MYCDALEKPLRSVASISIRGKDASVGSVVNAHSVMELVASNRSSFTITAGRGLAEYGAPLGADDASNGPTGEPTARRLPGG